jgi:hypothetical protein
MSLTYPAQDSAGHQSGFLNKINGLILSVGQSNSLKSLIALTPFGRAIYSL